MFIYYDCNTDATAHALRDKTGFDGGSSLPTSLSTPIINWGKPCRLSNYTNVFNRTIVHNKVVATKIMRDAGVKCPEIWAEKNEIPRYKYPVLGRDYSHSCGKDIELLNKPNKYERQYYVRYIPKIAEFRVHVIGQTSFISQKIPSEYSDTAKVCWNSGNSFLFRDIALFKSAKLTHDIRDLAHRAVTALGYDFGAVDIILSEYGELYCLEVNSAPALATHRVWKYAELIKFNWGGVKW